MVLSCSVKQLSRGDRARVQDPANAPRFDHLTRWAARAHRVSRSTLEIRQGGREGRVDRRLRKMRKRVGEGFHGDTERDGHHRASIVTGGKKCLDIGISDLTAS